jgi:PAS domain S-box-containing protein
MDAMDGYVAAVVEVDRSGRVLGMNGVAERLLEGQGLVKQDIARVLPPDFASLVERCRSSRGELVHSAVRLGPRRIMWVFVPDAEEERAYVHGLDITPWEQPLATSAAARDHLMRILSSAGDGIAILTGDYDIEFQNEVLIRRFGERRGEKCYRVMADREVPCEDCVMVRALESGTVERAEKTSADGQVYDISSSPFLDVDGHLKVIQIVRDVTARMKAERALYESEELFRSIVESSHDVFYMHDTDGVLQYVSPNAKDLYGFDFQPGSLRWTDLLSDNPINQRATEWTERALRSGEKQARYELELVNQQGRRVWVEITETPRIRDGRVVGMIGAAHDITERKHAEEALRESEERYRALIEQNPVAIFLAQDGRFVYMNSQGADLLGYDLDEVVGMEVGTVVHPDHRELVRERTFRRQAGEEIPPRYEIRVLTKSGETRYVDLAASPFRHRGRPAVICHTIDITDRKRTEQALRAAEARYRDLYENATDIIYTHDLDGNITSLNVAAEKLLGWSRTAWIGRNVRDWVHPDSLPVANRSLEDKLLHPDRASRPYEIQVFDAKGALRWLEINSRLIFGQGDPVGVTGIARDITERKSLEAQLRQAQKMEALGQLAGGVAHDFNNLLTGILGYTRLLVERLRDDPMAQDDLAQIDRAAERAAALTRQLLAFSRRQQLSSIYLDLNRAVVDIIKLLSRTVGEHIEIRTDLGPDLASVYADPAQIEQILLNLAINARDAMPNGGCLTIATRMVEFTAQFAATHPWARRGRFVMLTVNDMGSGMDSFTRERAFEPFFTTKSPDKGTGLGLSIVYGIVKQHDGLISLDSEPGQGTTVYLYFPAAEHPADEQKEETAEWPAGGQECILIAEDEPIVRDLATQVLTEAGYKIVPVCDGEEALTALRAQPEAFDLIILDMVMPRKGGAEVWKAVGSLASKARVLLTSGYAADSAQVRVGVPEGPAFLGKPFTPIALLRKVRETLDAGK